MLASISIDLDGLDLYHAIHGLTPPTGSNNPVYEVGLRRFLDLFDELGVPSTLFVVTRYLERAEVERVLVDASEAGHELASHTHNHPYDLRALPKSQIELELDLAAGHIERICGTSPVGFRTPGYNLDETILACLDERGYRYDSSVFPCPPYYFAKALVMAGMRLRGRSSGSSMTDPRSLLAPLQPYHPMTGRWHRPGGQQRQIVEVPMCVVPGLRVPVIGTSLALFGTRFFHAVFPLLRHFQPMLNLEFHGIDLMDEHDEGVSSELVEKQPDLRRSWQAKRAIFKAVFETVLKDYHVCTLANGIAAARL